MVVYSLKPLTSRQAAGLRVLCSQIICQKVSLCWPRTRNIVTGPYWHWTRNIVTGPNYVDTGPGTLSLDLIMLTLDWEHCHRTKNTITGPHYVEVGLETLSLVSMLTHVCQWTSNTISPQISQQKSLHFKWFANQFILNHSQPWKVDMLRHKKSVVKLLPLA